VLVGTAQDSYHCVTTPSILCLFISV